MSEVPARVPEARLWSGRWLVDEVWQKNEASWHLCHSKPVDDRATVIMTITRRPEMFDVDCPVHGCTVLLPISRLRGMANTERGIVLVFECYDGARIELVTGRAPAPAPA
jgi:hypothetical protein